MVFLSSLFEDIDGSAFNDVTRELIPETHDSLAEEIPSHFLTTAFCGYLVYDFADRSWTG